MARCRSRQAEIIAYAVEHPDATYKQIAAAVGVAYATAQGTLTRWRSIERCKAIHEAEKAKAAKLVRSFDPGTGRELAETSLALTQRAIMQDAYRQMDLAAVNGDGPTVFKDAQLVGLLDGVCALVLGQFADLYNSKTQAVWECRARELNLLAAFITSSIIPLARRGSYRGLDGERFFTQLAAYIRKRMRAGVLG